MRRSRQTTNLFTVIQFLSTQFNVANPGLTPALVSFNTKVLRGLSVSNRTDKTRSFLASSPVKYLSSFLSGSSSSDPASNPKFQRALTSESSSNSATHLPGQLDRSNSTREAASLYGSVKSRDERTGSDDDRPENPIIRLEQTFTAYMAILLERKGSFVGRTLLNRSTVDELSVNELYNRLIENPFDLETAPDVTADIVFVAFEKFVRIAWHNQMGPIISANTLDALQQRASKKLPGDFADFVHYLFSDMAPQNRRAFTALIKLLAELLGGCENDSDQGGLTLAVAEILVDNDNAADYINLLDRLVEDCDRIFEDNPASFPFSLGPSATAFEPINWGARGGKSHNGSVTSNTSSLRRKFGFDNLLMRQNSKADSDSRSSVWRSLSKHARNPATGEPSSLSRGTITRTGSVDVGLSSATTRLRRPGSRDRPPIAGAFDDAFSRPNSSQKLETIGEPGDEGEVQPYRRKRRSSLSDLKHLMDAATIDDEVPLQPLSDMKETSEKFNASPRGPGPSKTPISPNTLQSTNSPALLLSKQKENIDDPCKTISLPIEPPRMTHSPANENPRKMHSKMLSTSNIPTLKPTQNLVDVADTPTRPTTSPSKGSGKLRLQSPQRLRERLQVEKKVVEEVDANLRSELSKISADMAKVNSTLPRSGTVDLRKLSSSIQSLEERLPMVLGQLANRQDQLQRDMDNSVRASEAKVKAIDQLYKETMAENELLYEKFNSELGKIVKALKGKGREEKEELMGRIKDSSEESARLKKDNARLKREIVSLRALIKGSSGGSNSTNNYNSNSNNNGAGDA